MARLSYQAPGVYVEEVPSSQKAIAGVGTNTVGFIGIVPDEIEYPVPNENYDPTLADKAAIGPDQNQERIGRLETEVNNIEEQRTRAKKDQDDAAKELENKDLKENQKKPLEKKRDDAKKEEQALKEKIASKRQEINTLKRPPDMDASKVKPYRLEKFTLTAEPGVTRL